MKIIHAIWPVTKSGPIAHRQDLFLQSSDLALRPNVLRIATSETWKRNGWKDVPPGRNASLVGDSPFKPFLKDIFDVALRLAQPEDWLVSGNVDCAISPDFYDDLTLRRCTVVEYMRQDVLDDPQTLDDLFRFRREPYPMGLDVFAFRAGFYAEIQKDFPDFILGEPHWDTALSEILRRLVPVQRDEQRLYHPKHDQAWDFANLSPAGRHNNTIYVNALTYGIAQEHVIGPVTHQTDTAVIIPIFGNGGLRGEAMKEAIGRQLQQDLWCDTYIIELLREGERSELPAEILSRVRHIPVLCPPEAEGIFQKEALLNIGWKTARTHHSYDYFILVDADVYCGHPSWFRQIRAKLQANPAKVVQGFRTVLDTVDPGFCWSSLAAAFRLGRPTDLPLNPGICWGVHHKVLEAAGGLNPFSLGSSGDSLFVAEFLNKPALAYDPWLFDFPWFQEIFRHLPFRAEFDCVDMDLLHVHHGPAAKRNYDGIRYAMAGYGPVKDWLGTNEQGLVVWKKPNGVEHELSHRRDEMNTREDVDRMFGERGLTRCARPASPVRLSEKPVFSIPGWTPAPTLLTAGLPDSQGARDDARQLNVFNPKKMYREDFPFSWCGNVRRKPSNHIPTATRDGVPRLVLEGLPEVPWMTGLLAVESNWQSVDLRPYSRLHFTFLLDEERMIPVTVGLVFTHADGTEIDSRVVQLASYGLQPGRRADFEIPLQEFGSAEELSVARLIRWTAGDSFRMEISRVYIV